MAKRYFRGPQEPGSPDLEYIEFTDGWPSRQVDVVGGRYYSSLDEVIPGVAGGLADQSLAALDLPGDWEIPPEQFEQAWQQARADRGQGD